MILSQLTNRLGELGPAERRVAAAVAASPQPVTQMSLATLCGLASVSEPTVIRLCRKIGCTGFPDFKMRLAQELAAGASFVHQEIEHGDALADVAPKIVRSTISALTGLLDTLDLAAMERAVAALSRAHRIDFFGTGPSSTPAREAQQKFLPLDVPAVYHSDTHLQIMSTVALRPTDVAVCFSYTGQTADIVRCATLAAEAGATVIGVTRRTSALAARSTILVPVDTPDDTFVYSPTTMRLAHLVVVDILSTGVALQRGPGVTERFRRMKDTLLDKRIVPAPGSTG
jgi:RpiR family carbohydrate utilization transcriptional regulator